MQAFWPATPHEGMTPLDYRLRLNQGRFQWPAAGSSTPVALTQQQFDALVLGLPWQRLEQMQRITLV
jgi:transposase